MCGIAGLVMKRGVSPDRAILGRMADVLAHRGPDGCGIHVVQNVGMIQMRLAIIDLATGQQPLYTPGGTAIVGNGEIYNYRELYRDPELEGVDYKTSSDFEPALHLFERLGLDFTAKLRGMYAIAIHDPEKEQLTLFRDPFGIKPLYYFEADQYFAFASEPRALIPAGLPLEEPDPETCRGLICRHYLLGRDTGFPRAKRLLPGEKLVIADGRIVSTYRDQALSAGSPVPSSEAEALEWLDVKLRESVALHLRSDVPYGLFLSGGIDSSTLLAIMSREAGAPVHTFSMGFRSKSVTDERSCALAVAKRFGSDHTPIEFSEEDFWNLIPKVAGAFDDPTTDFAILPTYKLASVATSSVKVILSGEGGDEFFAGYNRYRNAARQKFSLGALLGRGVSQGSATPSDAGWLRDALCDASLNTHIFSAMQLAQLRDIADWLPHDLLLKLDRCLMAHGIEGRTPFVDKIVSSFAFGLPDALKFEGRLGKILLRRWLSRNCPAATAFGRKRGFRVPVHDWMSRQAERIGPLVARQRGVARLYDAAEVLALFERSRPETYLRRWNLLFFAAWHQHHFRGVSGARDVFEHLSAA